MNRFWMRGYQVRGGIRSETSSGVRRGHWRTVCVQGELHKVAHVFLGGKVLILCGYFGSVCMLLPIGPICLKC